MSRPATSRLKVNPPVGQLPVLQYCAPDQLLIDESYQRSLEVASSQTLIRRIAVHWDWRLCQPLIVARRADGGLYVVDGQHRLAAAKLRGDIWQLPCVVASYRNAAEEAASFVALNQQRRPLNRLQIFRAALAAGDETAAVIHGALDDAGLWIGTSLDLTVQKPGAVSNVAGLENCLRTHGQEVLAAALDVLAQAYKGQVLRYAGTIFPGIAAVVADEAKRIILHDAWQSSDGFVLLTEMVGGAEQVDWVREINLAVANGASRRNIAAEQVFRAAWAECTEAALDEAA